MENFRMEYELARLRGDVVFIGAAIVGALLLNAFILTQIGNDLYCLKQMEKEKRKSQIPPGEDEVTEAAETTTEQPAATTEQKPVTETKTEDEKQ
ncbi:MAG TPA: hypothetical protein VLB84_20710 [Bacteroidia bacterium]|nr:hypothetical protein [Bacteroidia bacterium]